MAKAGRSSDAAFSRAALVRRTLRGGRRSLLPVLLGVAVATATIVGALLVGDSVRGSLRAMALDRLGRVDQAIASPQFLTERLTHRMNRHLPEGVVAAGAIRLPGTIKDPITGTVAQVDVVGVDIDSWAMLNSWGNPYGFDGASTFAAAGGLGWPQAPNNDEVLLNAHAAAELAVPLRDWSAAAGGSPIQRVEGRFALTGEADRTALSTELSLLVELPSAIPRDSLLGDRDEQVVELPMTLPGNCTPDQFLVADWPARARWANVASSFFGVRKTARFASWLGLPFYGSDPVRFSTICQSQTVQPVTIPYWTGGRETQPGAFSLSPSQQSPRLAFVNLADLQEHLDLATRRPSRFDPEAQPARLNTVFLHDERAGPLDDPSLERLADTADADAALRKALRIEDFGLKLVRLQDSEEEADSDENDDDTAAAVAVQTRSLILPTPLEDAARKAAATLGHRADSVLVYLVNEIRPADADDENPNNETTDDDTETNGDEEDAPRRSAYSVAAGLDLAAADFAFVGEAPTLPLGDGGVLINEWLAADLGVAAGDAIEVDAFPAGSIGEVPAVTHAYRVAGVVRMRGDGANPALTPSVPGITDADSFADWEQPFDMDLERVTNRDEDYWDEYRAAPKLFLPLDAMQETFASKYGRATSVRVRGDGDPVNVEAVKAALLDAVDPVALGIAVQPVKAQQLAAASGTTDFSGLFLGFSFFLIAAALLLVGLLFRLAVERRAAQLGLLGAIGFSPRQVRNLLLIEGAVVTLLGTILGALGGWAFAAVMLHGLRTWWSGAIGTSQLELHVQPSSLLVGMAAAGLTALGTMAWAVRTLHRQSVRGLLAGRTADPLDESQTRARRRLARRVAIGAAASAAVLLVASLAGLLGDAEAFTGFSLRVVGFFLVGVLALVAAIAALAALLDGGSKRPDESASLGGLTPQSLAWRNAARARGRSLLTASLIASACFVLVAVAVAKRDPASETPDRASGNGGYLLIAESTAPLLFDLNTDAGRRDAGFRGLSDDDGVDLAALRIDALARRPGDDASCLNLYRAQLPTLLGVPDDTLRRWAEESRFRFADTPADGRWAGLLTDIEGDPADPIVPVIGDLNTLQYSLKLGLGDRLAIPESTGSRGSLEVIGMLDSSVFQGVLLMRESHLKALFPDVVGRRTFLVEAIDPATGDATPEPDGGLSRRASITATLERGLADYGLDAEPVAERIARFLAVQNTYLATFQTLGGLGLLLGTIGLAAVMLRNIAERRRELALLRAVGFAPGRLRGLVLRENLALLLWGLAAGTLAALVAMLPHLRSTGADVPWRSLLGLLAAIAGVGTLAALWAVRRAARVDLLAGLRAE